MKSRIRTKAIIHDSEEEEDDTIKINPIKKEKKDKKAMNTMKKEKVIPPEVSFHISRKKVLTVGQFYSRDIRIDIRNTYIDKTNTAKALKGKGVSLTLGQWKKMQSLMADINVAIEKYQDKQYHS